MSIIEAPREIELPEKVERETIVTEADLLDRAADVLEEFGWVTGNMAVDEEGEEAGIKDGVGFCMAGAYARAIFDLMGYVPDTEAVATTLNDRYAKRLGTDAVVNWNDDQLEADPVIGFFRERARELRSPVFQGFGRDGAESAVSI